MHIFERLLGGKEYAISKFLLLHIFERLLGFVQRIFFLSFLLLTLCILHRSIITMQYSILKQQMHAVYTAISFETTVE